MKPDPQDRIRLIDLAPAAVLTVATAVAAASLGLRPSDPRQAAGVFPIWWSQARALDAAARAGRVVAVGAAPFVVIAHSDHRDLAAGLRANGAWLVIDPGIAAACGS